MPAPPPESEPAMVQTMGGLLGTAAAGGGWWEGWLEEEEEEDAMMASGWRGEVRLRTGMLLLGFDFGSSWLATEWVSLVHACACVHACCGGRLLLL